jgi:general secretion pathway protein L
MRLLSPRTQAALARAVDWWLAELRSLLPAKIRRLMVSQNRLVFLAEETGLRLLLEADGTTHDLDGVRTRSDLSAALSRAKPGAHRAPSEIVLRLPAGQALTGSVKLPAAAGENLREVVGFEMDRFTPFAAGEVYYDCRSLDRSDQGQSLLVALTALPRTVVDPLLERLAEIGVRPDTVDVAESPEAGAPPLNLLPPERRSQPPRLHRCAVGALSCLLLTLLVVLVALPLHEKTEIAEALTAKVATARQEAQKAKAIEADLNALLRERALLIDPKITRPSMTEMLDEAARLLPDDSWLFRFRWNGEEIELSGYSADATQLIDLFESAPAFDRVRFAAPVVNDPAAGRERFILLIGVSNTAQAPKQESTP